MKTSKIVRFKPVTCGNKTVDVNHQFSNADLARIMIMPKIGKRLTFTEAYRLRWHELSYKNYLFSYKSMNESLIDWCRTRGYYIDIEECEVIDPIPKNVAH